MVLVFLKEVRLCLSLVLFNKKINTNKQGVIISTLLFYLQNLKIMSRKKLEKGQLLKDWFGRRKEDSYTHKDNTNKLFNWPFSGLLLEVNVSIH